MGQETITTRLLEYKCVLKKMRMMGFTRVYSSNLADSLGVSSSLVRKDFSCLTTVGNKRGGYQIEPLLAEIHKILHRGGEATKAVVAGAGKLGKALCNYGGFEEENIHIVAAFDSDSKKVGNNERIPVLHIENLTSFISRNKITIGVLAVPAEAAQKVADLMIMAGVRGFLNFAPTRLSLPSHCRENHINLALELEKLILILATSETEPGQFWTSEINAELNNLKQVEV
ncbi:MAG: redox-sensing transcriptional repressor Rex [Fibrobacter sp.]|nr:redox-sensing transcriptional repressor Rex [Fibrobacter sp.]